MQNPRVSVIVPVHNTERYLRECLDSILSQTESNLEVICIDDGSSDSSPAILREYSEKDSRIVVLRQKCKGAGTARNLGLTVARGTNLAFLDSDDFFEKGMLKDACDALDARQADIVAFRSWAYSEAHKANRIAKWTFVADNVPPKDVFSWKDMPDVIFNTFGNYTWNKVFRASLIFDNNLSFQEISRTNDLLFVCTALMCATRITTIDECYVHYRMGTKTSLQATNDRDVLAFYQAFCSLQDYLMKKGLYQDVERSFINHALDGVISNVNSLKTLSGFTELRARIIDTIEKRFDFLGQDPSIFRNQAQLEQYRALCTLDPTDYLFLRAAKLAAAQEDSLYYTDWIEWRLWRSDVQLDEFQRSVDSLQRQNADLEEQCRQVQQELDDVRRSRSFRIGMTITKPLRFAKSLFSR